MVFRTIKYPKALENQGQQLSNILGRLRLLEFASKNFLSSKWKNYRNSLKSPMNLILSTGSRFAKTYIPFLSYVEKELKRIGVTRTILWSEYKTKHPQGVIYSQICEHYNKWNLKSEGYIPTTHKAGEKLFIDYAGKKRHIIEKQTGEIKPVEVFVATLGASQYTYVKASFSQQIPDFISSVQNCLHYLGGIPACIIPDNLKSAVTKSNRYEPHLNEQFACFASHYDI